MTTGIASIDLLFSSELLEPEDGQPHYREQLIKLPGTGCCTTAFDKIGLQDDLVVATLADYIDKAVLLATESPQDQAASRRAISSASAAANDLSVVRAFEREPRAQVLGD